MRHLTCAAAAALSILALAGCSPKPAVDKQVATPPAVPATTPAAAPNAKVPVNTTCPVEKGNKVNPKLTVEYKGKTYAFCCADCPPKFKADPEKYIAELAAPMPEGAAKEGGMDHSKMNH